MDATSRPALRPIETLLVPDRQHGRVLLLRDTQGVTDANAVVPSVLIPVVARFTGALSCEDIARAASADLGEQVPVEVVVRLAAQLDDAFFLDTPRLREERVRVAREFAQAEVRPASHAGGAYHGDAHSLARYLDESCLALALREPGRSQPMVGLIAPHIDPWRGALCYGRAYGALAEALPPQVDTFVVFGTSHAPMRQPFSLCRKAFDTPLGQVQADLDAVDALANAASSFDPYADQFNHKREHSLEFQVVFLKHLMKRRPFAIVPILAGLGALQSSGQDPSGHAAVSRFVGGVRDLLEARPGRVVVVAGADLAHVGPRFGDARAYGEIERETLEGADRASLGHAANLDPAAFWANVAGDLETRRVCGLAPIWSLLASVESVAAQGRVLHYEQTVDREDGSIVSHGAVGLFGR